MNLIERLVFIMKINNLSASAFADKIDVQRSSISHILSGRNKPSLELVQKVLKAFPKVNPNWLLTGNKTIDYESTTNHSIGVEQNNSTSNSVTPPNNEVIQKQINKIVVFYSDNTFEEFNSLSSINK